MSKEKLVHVQARLPESMRNDFKKTTKKNAQNISELIRLWIERYIEENRDQL